MSADEVRSWATQDGAVLSAAARPDGAWSVRLPDGHVGSWETLVRRAADELRGPMLVARTVTDDPDEDAALRAAGFSPIRTETVWRLPLAALGRRPCVHTEHRVLPVTALDPEDVAVLDNAIRHDIPGTSGWAGTGAQLLATLDDPEFDPALYRVAQHTGTGSLDGLIRVWNRSPDPRVGCLGVTRPWRRSRLALALVQDVARTLLERGVGHVVAETDTTNRASHGMARRHGGVALRQTTEWHRP